MNIFVGNLHVSATEAHLEQLFGAYAKVSSVKIIKDFETDTSRGYGFVEMDENEEAVKAIKNLNGSNVMDQVLEVSEAYPQQPSAVFLAAQDKNNNNNNNRRR